MMTLDLAGVRGFRVSVELRHLRYFSLLAEELNFTRAARRLGITQQSLSYSISQFENELAVRLVERSAQGLLLTSAGRAVLHDAQRVLADVAALAATARAHADRLEGTLRLGCSHDLQSVLTPLLKTLRSRQPDLTADVTVGSQRPLIDDLRAHRLDAVVTWRRPVEEADLRVHQLLSAQLLAVVRDSDPSRTCRTHRGYQRPHGATQRRAILAGSERFARSTRLSSVRMTT